MATLNAHERGWRDGFYHREPRECCEVYLEGWAAGHRASDRTQVLPAVDPGLTGPDAAGSFYTEEKSF